MDIARAVQFMMDDKDWMKKLGIGALITLASIFILPIFIIIGYGIQVARNVKDGTDTPLPEWSDWGTYFKDGFVVFIAAFVYSLPVMILIGIGAAVTGIGAATEVDAIAATGGLLFLLFGCIAGIYGLALVAMTPAIYIQYIEHGTLGACLNFRKVLDITRSNIGDILIVILVSLGISFAVSLVSWIPCLGWIIALAVVPYTQMVSGHLYGQIAAKTLGKGSKFDDIIIS